MVVVVPPPPVTRFTRLVPTFETDWPRAVNVSVMKPKGLKKDAFAVVTGAEVVTVETVVADAVVVADSTVADPEKTLRGSHQARDCKDDGNRKLRNTESKASAAWTLIGSLFRIAVAFCFSNVSIQENGWPFPLDTWRKGGAYVMDDVCK